MAVSVECLHSTSTSVTCKADCNAAPIGLKKPQLPQSPVILARCGSPWIVSSSRSKYFITGSGLRCRDWQHGFLKGGDLKPFSGKKVAGRLKRLGKPCAMSMATPSEQFTAQRRMNVAVTTIPTQEPPVQPSSRTGWFILGGFLLAGAMIFLLVQRWKQSQNRLIKKGEAPIEGPWLWKTPKIGTPRQPSQAEIEQARKKRADEKGGRQLRPVFVAEGQLPPEGTDPEAVIEIPRNHPWATADLDEVPIDVLRRRLDQRRGPPDQAHETWKRIRQDAARMEESFEVEGGMEAGREQERLRDGR